MIEPEPDWPWYVKLVWISIAAALLSPAIYFISTEGLDVFIELLQLELPRHSTTLQSSSMLCKNPYLFVEA